MILIGISNNGVAAHYWSCPDDSGNVKLGDSFSKFLKVDLIPEVKRNYRTNDYKILFGQSNAGLFVLYNFLSMPDLFNAYAIASPMFGSCPQFYQDKTKAFLSNNPSLNKILYVSYNTLYDYCKDSIDSMRVFKDYKSYVDKYFEK